MIHNMIFGLDHTAFRQIMYLDKHVKMDDTELKQALISKSPNIEGLVTTLRTDAELSNGDYASLVSIFTTVTNASVKFK